MKENAVELAKAMETEDGVSGAVRAFLKHLPKKKSLQAATEAPGLYSSLLGPLRRCFGCS